MTNFVRTVAVLSVSLLMTTSMTLAAAAYVAA